MKITAFLKSEKSDSKFLTLMKYEIIYILVFKYEKLSKVIAKASLKEMIKNYETLSKNKGFMDILVKYLISLKDNETFVSIFEGKQYEGHTMLPIINGFRDKYKLERLVVVADSGLLSSQNINELIANNYEFILGARIKNEKQEIKDEIQKLNLKNGECKTIKKRRFKPHYYILGT